MQRQETDAAYFARRAREEADIAALADRPEVAAAHRGLAMQYDAMAQRLGAAQDAAEPAPFSLARDKRLEARSRKTHA